jgi:DNA-binding SARP family transcriptional activator
LAASILNDFNDQLCNYLMERKDSALFLRSLEERNLFVSRTETKEGNSYRFHQLFSEFLQDYFRRHDRPRMQRLHSRAADWYRNHNDAEEAIYHKLASGEREEAAALMDSVAGTYFTSGRQILLARWLEQISQPPDLKHLAPHLMLYQAKTLGNQSRFKECLDLLDLVEPILEAQGDREALANALTTRGMVYRFTNKQKQAIDMASVAQKHLDGGKDKAQRSRQWYQAERLRGVPLHILGKTEEGVAHLKSAAAGLRELASISEGSLKTVYLFDLAECLNDLGLIYITTGQMLNAQQSYQEALEIHISIRSNLGALANGRNNIAYLNHQVGHYAEAWREYSLALENARAANRAREQIAILSGRGELLAELEEYDEALSNYEQAIVLGDQANESQQLVSVFVGMARIQKSKQDYNEAMNYLRKAASLGNGHFDPDQYALELGQIYMDMGQEQLALNQFEDITSKWELGSPPTQTQVLATFQSARIQYKNGRKEAAYDLASRFLEGTAQLGYDQFIVATGASTSEFLTEIANHVNSSQAKNLAQRASEFRPGKLSLDQAAEAEAITPTSLEIQAFGSGEVRKNGELIPATEWRSNRARSLFFYILDQGRVRKDAIGLDFWADFSPAKVSSNFHATLWRVRQALGFKDAILFENDHYSLHPSISAWYDVSEFQNYIRLAGSSSISNVERSEFLRQAVRLYNGPYLQDVYMEWADKRREELRGLYLDVLVSLAKIESQNNRFAEAKELYEKIVALDPYRDETHLALMKCQVEIGSKSAAIAHYKRYKALLRKELNAEPMPELETYFNQITVKA